MEGDESFNVTNEVNENYSNGNSIVMVCNAINYLQKKNTGRYVENVIEQCKSYGWDDDTISCNIDEAIKSRTVIEKTYNSKPSLRVKINDPIEKAAANTSIDYVKMDEFIDFKSFINNAISNIPSVRHIPSTESNYPKEQFHSFNESPGFTVAGANNTYLAK